LDCKRTNGTNDYHSSGDSPAPRKRRRTLETATHTRTSVAYPIIRTPSLDKYEAKVRICQDFIARGEGFSLLILESKDARADATTFSAAGVAASEDLRFEREAKRPDGSTVKVGFSLAFAEDKAARDIHFASCQQHYPENFWNPAFQEHSNSVAGVVGVVVVANQPEQHQQFFEVFADAPAVARHGGFAIATPRGMIEVVSPAAFLQRFGVKPPDMTRGARLAALRFAVTQPSRLQAVPELAGIAGLYVGNDAIVGSEDAMGAILVFEPSAQKPR
jgi:hypothetical protein